VGNIYHLAGEIVTGGVAVTTSGESDVTSTHLWHMHLGHMSERNLKESSKQLAWRSKNWQVGFL
jgi:hypothetical protein